MISLAYEEVKCIIVVSHSAKVREAADWVYFLELGKLTG
jgi:ABC-type lipoprotein export system ATPase subunit